MAEAAEAIRRPKPMVQQDQLPSGGDQTVDQSSDELQRIAKISETGGAIQNTNGVASERIPGEIQEELEQNY